MTSEKDFNRIKDLLDENKRLEGALEDIKHGFIGVMRYPHGYVTCACCERMQTKASAALEQPT